MFARSAGVWSLEAKLVPSDGSSSDRFGQCVAIAGDVVIGGVPNDNVLGVPNQGTVYSFVFENGEWTDQGRINAPDGVAGDSFGDSVAIDGQTLAIGAPGVDGGGNSNQGAAFAFIPGESSAWIDLEDGPIAGTTAEASGSDTAALAIVRPDGIAPVRFRCRVINSCGTTLTAPAELTVCFADYDCSGAHAVPDIFAFLSAWFAGDPAAFEFGGTPGVPAIFAFLSAWFAGCP